jgi:hypothetical protein
VSRIIAIARWAAVIGLVLLGVFYAVEGLRPQTETLTFYYSTRLKNGREQVFYDQPQTEVCVRAVFPHGGRRPCWYARRKPVRVISLAIPRRPKP